MQEFVHTFSMVRSLSEQEHQNFKCTYGSKYFFNSDKKKSNKGKKNLKFVLSKYADDGLKVEVRKRKYEDRNNDPLRREYKATIIITPHKLLSPGKQMGKLTNIADIQAASSQLINIISKIEKDSGVNLWKEAELRRVDITKDVTTPSDLYSAEIIKASKQAVRKCGYDIFRPEKSEGYNPEWPIEDSALFYSHSQEVAAKIYNKLHDLEEAERKEYSGFGLIRFELTLKQKRLIDLYNIGEVLLPDGLSGLLCKITEDGSMLLDKYIAQTLFPGAMVSRNVLRKHLKLTNKGKKNRTEEMLKYSSWVTKVPPECYTLCGTESEIRTRKRWFEEASVSPVCVRNRCPYIPSFSDLLNGVVDQYFLDLALDVTKKKKAELDYWTV